MNEQMNEQTTNSPEEQQGKTFTQDDVNRIIQDRLAKERAKTGAELEAKAANLAAREFALSKKQLAAEKQIPIEVLDQLNASNADDLKKAIDKLEEWKNTKPKPIPRIVAGGTAGGASNAIDRFRDAMGLNRKE